MRFSIPIKVAAALLILWLTLLGGYTVWFQTRTWAPVEDLDVPLVPGAHRQAQFKLNRDGRFNIELRAQGKVEEKQLECMMGNGFQEKCGDIKPITALWTLTDLTNSDVIHGTSAGTEGYGGLIGSTGEQIRTIGRFRGEKGHRYRVELTVTSAAVTLASVSGKLEVGIGDTSFESALVVEQMAIFFTPIVFVVCVSVIGICVYLKHRASSAKRQSAL